MAESKHLNLKWGREFFENPKYRGSHILGYFGWIYPHNDRTIKMPAWYVWLYTHIGPGIPWTWIVRAAEKNWPLAFMVGFLLLGMLLAWKFRAQTIPWLIGFAFGAFSAHFWWCW